MDGLDARLVRQTFQRRKNFRRPVKHAVNRSPFRDNRDNFGIDYLRCNEGAFPKMARDIYEHNERPDSQRRYRHGNFVDVVVYGNRFAVGVRLDFVGAYRLQRPVCYLVYNAAVDDARQKFLRGGFGFGRVTVQGVQGRRFAGIASEYLRGIFIGVHDVGGRFHHNAFHQRRGRRHIDHGNLRRT